MTRERRIAALSFVGLIGCVATYHALNKPGQEAPPSLELEAPMKVEPASHGLPVGESPAPKPKYTNEQLHSMLQQQQQALGISAVGEDAEPEEQPGGFMRPGEPGERENVEDTLKQLAAMRKLVQGNKAGNVAIDGRVAPVLNEGPRGRPLEGEAERPAALPIESNLVVRHEDGSWSGSFGGPEPGELVVRDAKSWRALWTGLSRDPLPAVDFKKQMVVMVNLGVRPTGGFQARITGAALKDFGLLVTVEELEPPGGRTPPQERTAPFALRVVQRTIKPVRFEKTAPKK